MPAPDDRRYLDTHEWHKPDPSHAGMVTLGITQFAADELTDITFVDVTKKSGAIKAGESFGEVESVKATSEVYCGIDGEIVAVNQAVIDNPALLNSDPFEAGWIIRVRARDVAQVQGLLSADEYNRRHA